MGGIAFCALVLLCSESVMEAYTSMTAGHPFFMGFCKFALLATLGECLALRLTKGVYMTAGFGLIPRAVVWGCLGVAISAAFMIFSAGAPVILHDEDPDGVFRQPDDEHHVRSHHDDRAQGS